MPTLSRRRFLTIAACTGVLGSPASAAPDVTQWRATALGARVTLSLSHPDAGAIAERVFAELRRLEAIFSLYRPDSSLSLLNRAGTLPAPPFELLECLSLCSRVHTATGGLFDPSVQPLWQAYAQYHTSRSPDQRAIDKARRLVGWSGVAYDAASVRFGTPGMALTLNGIAQGYIADRVADMLRREGLRDVMVDTGELRALGGHPQGGDWPVTLENTNGAPIDRLGLRDAALASSAPSGTYFDSGSRAGHILNPLTGHPARTAWNLISVTGPSAALADGLSTAMCLMEDRQSIQSALSGFPGMALMHLS